MNTEDDTAFKLKYSQQEIDAAFEFQQEALDYGTHLQDEYLKQFAEDGPTNKQLDIANNIANIAYNDYTERNCKDLNRYYDIMQTLG